MIANQLINGGMTILGRPTAGLLFTFRNPALQYTHGILPSLLHLSNKNEKDQKNNKQEDLITVVDSNNKILGVKTKLEATKLANKQCLNLVKWEGPDAPAHKFQVYKLSHSAELLDKQFERDPKKKASEKNLLLAFKISDHDLEVKINAVRKWLEKNHEVKVLIQGTGGKGNLDNIFSKIETEVKNHGQILQKVQKNSSLKFIIQPLPKK